MKEFYIGWMPNAPRSFTRFIRRYLLLLLVAIVTIGAILALKQKPFSTANFEFGKLTTVTGIYASLPVPHLLVPDKNDYSMIPLVGYGKHGAEGVMQDLQQAQRSTLENKEVELKGTLLYGDGKILMQVDKNDNPLVAVSATAQPNHMVEEEQGIVRLQGEIIDPKCYFGVMKPGEGKPHKDCAIRCISGGIPPVLKLTNEKGEKNYILLTNANGTINQQVQDFVATPAEVYGHLKKVNDWLILDVTNMQTIATTSPVPDNMLAQQCSLSCGPAHLY